MTSVCLICKCEFVETKSAIFNLERVCDPCAKKYIAMYWCRSFGQDPSIEYYEVLIAFVIISVATQLVETLIENVLCLKHASLWAPVGASLIIYGLNKLCRTVAGSFVEAREAEKYIEEITEKMQKQIEKDYTP